MARIQRRAYPPRSSRFYQHKAIPKRSTAEGLEEKGFAALSIIVQKISKDIENDALERAKRRIDTLLTSIPELVHIIPHSFKSQVKLCRFKDEFPKVLHRFLLRQASLMDAAVSGLALAGLCEQVVFNAPERPLYSQQFLGEWHFWGGRLLGLCGPVENSEFRPGPLQLLIAAGWFEEIDPTINRLRFVGKKLIAIAVFASGAYNLLLPRIFPIKELAQLRDDLHKVYEVGTLSVQRMCGQVAPTSWERDAQVELDQFRDLGTVLATFCDAAILRLQGPVPRTRYTGSVHARLDNVLEKFDYAYTAGMQRIMEKGGNTFKEMQKLNKKPAEELDELKQCRYMTQETASARLYKRRCTSRPFLNPAVCLMPIDPSSFRKDALQELDKKWRRVSSIFDDDTKHQEIAGTFLRCECHEFFVLGIWGGDDLTEQQG